MNEMVERVARALSRRHFMRKKQMSWQTSEFQEALVARLVEDHWRNHEQDAKDAIAAMREPTQAMMDCGNEAAYQCERRSGLRGETYGRDTWQAMIDEALK